jgi:CRP/FNR family transcriptional regulator, cyclic AMP receptor protein
MANVTGVDATELGGHSFLHGMPAGYVAVLARACRVTVVPAAHQFFAEGDPANQFWLISTGHVALELHSPGRGRLIIETLGQGDLLGLSWLVPPFQWQFGGRAVQETMTFELNAALVRAACEHDPGGLGYQLLQRVMSAASSRLQAARIRMLDLYAASGTDRVGPGR